MTEDERQARMISTKQRINQLCTEVHLQRN